ncbi:sodium-coupled monocarboxylate transporter 2-like isoform X2 [Haemaphysalis longicornis]
MASIIEYVVFGVMMALNFGLGLYFSLRRKARSAHTPVEVFLGSRALRVVPLAASVVATLMSSTGLVGFTGHFYAYGFHLIWHGVACMAMAPIAGRLFLPVMYGLRVTSIFEYIRKRFNPAISLTACGTYIFLTQTLGAMSIFAASLTIVTAFDVPLLWCNILIGFCGTFYTALGGLRGVVWTDCMQLVFILLAPATVITKVIVDSNSANSTVQPVSDFDARVYLANTKFDITHDENILSALVGSATFSMYRVCLDQVVAQRFLASRTLGEAQRTVVTGSLLLVTAYIVHLSMVLALVVWFRGCDPLLSGAIKSHDQILPFYIKNNLVRFLGFSGIFLAAVVSAATSTISSIINSQAAVLYVDVVTQHSKNLNSHVRLVTRGLAFSLGTIMTLYSCVCFYMGTVTRVVIMVYSAATGPFVGLFILAVAFPFVHSKGAGIATVVMLAVQLVIMWQTMTNGAMPPRMPATLDYCPENKTNVEWTSNNTVILSKDSLEKAPALFRLSPFWSCLFSTVGEHREPSALAKHTNDFFFKLWQRIRVVKGVTTGQVEEEMAMDSRTTKLLSTEEN